MEFILKSLQEPILRQLRLSQESNILDHQTGFMYISNIQKYFPNGYGVRADEYLAIYEYTHGILIFNDPLCALKLYPSLHKRNFMNAKTLCKVLVINYLNLIYGFRDVQTEQSLPQYSLPKSFNFHDGILELLDLASQIKGKSATIIDTLPLIENKDFHLAVFEYVKSERQDNYDGVLREFEKLKSPQMALHHFTAFFVGPSKTKNKQPALVYKLLSQTNNCQIFFTQLMFNLKLGQEESPFIKRLVIIALELCYTQQQFVYKKAIEALYQQQFKDYVLSNMIVKLYAKVFKNGEVLEKFLQQQSQVKSPIICYYLLKLKPELKDQYAVVCSDLFSTGQNNRDDFTEFVYKFYQIKLECYHNRFYTKDQVQVDPKAFDGCIKFYESASQVFNYTITLQFYNLYQRAKKQEAKISRLNIKAHKQFEALGSKQLDIQNYAKEQLEKSQTDRKLGCKRLQTFGPSIDLWDQLTIDSSDANLDTILRKVNSGEIEDFKLISKSNRDGDIYHARFNNQNVFVKVLNNLNLKEAEAYIASFKNFNHPNVLQPIGYMLSKVCEVSARESLNLYLIYPLGTYNVRSYLKNNRQNLLYQDLLKIVQQICDAVVYLIGEGVYCYNLHPNNVIMFNDVPLIVDFNFPIDLDTMNQCYNSEEMFTENSRPSQQNTFYSLGCLLLFILFQVEFKFQTEISEQKVPLEKYSMINPWKCKNVEFLLPPGIEAEKEKARKLILSCIQNKINSQELLYSIFGIETF